ncbi:MAG: RagB/SusD family nutrient uptake outer membrane protein [Bacteroidota bacterium]|nr:RagB/SusD family nutrient uptake outer membrane protein [Bacteroidota bacterium]
MKKILKISIAFILVLLTGCSTKYLDPVPQTSLSDLSVFDTKDRIVAQVNGMYAFMKSGAFQGGRFFVYEDVKADNFIPKSSNLVTNFATWNHTEVSSTNEVQNCWGAIYAAVNAINVFLDGLTTRHDAGTLPTTVSQADYDQYRSEALTLRAICYFDLLQLYTKPYNQGSGANPGVPLRLKAEKSSEGNDLARSTVTEVYAQILKDLNEAEPLAVSTYSTDLLNTTRIHKNTIIAFKTRVYLHMGDWAKVVSESAKIVTATAPFTAPSGVAFALNPSFTAIFQTPYTSKESIFSMPFTTTDGPGTQNGLPHYYSFSSSESYYLNVNPGFAYALMDVADVRKTSLVLNGGNYFLSKYPDFTTLTNYAPVIRYAEVLLNRSEALVRAGSAVTQEAVDLLNAVRTRSFPAGAYTTASFAAAADFYNAILLERDIEFLGEGIRTMDLQRLSLPFPAKDGGSMGSVPAIPSSSIGYIWPIPANELSLNKLMTPNQ